MKNAINQCQEFGYVLEHLEDYNAAIEKLNLATQLIEDIKNEFQILNGKDQLQALRERASQIGYNGEEVLQLETYIKMGQEEFIKNQMKVKKKNYF